MNNDSGKSTSIWMNTESIPPFEALDHDHFCDVCIIGAGISGLTSAYMLLKEGKTVTIIEDGPLVGGETARTTAHLASALDDMFCVLEQIHGEKGAKLAYESHRAAIDKIEEIVKGEGIDCDFSRLEGYLFASPEVDEADLKKELEAVQRVGFLGVEMVNSVPLFSFETGPAIKFPNQGQFHVIKYLLGLSVNIVLNGGKIFTHTKAVNIEDGKLCKVKTEKGFTIRSKHVIVATNSPVNDVVTMHTKQAPYRSYAIGAIIPKGYFPKILLWDTQDPYHYIRIQQNSSDENTDILIVGGEDHKTGQENNPEKAFEKLIAWSKERFPLIKSIPYRWSGQVMEPVDSLAFLGRNPGGENVFIITGYSGHGMTHATIGAMLITDLIMERPNEWEGMYSPARISLLSTKEFLKENLNVAVQYLDWFKGSEVNTINDIEPGSGAVIRKGLKKIAVYKDPSGNISQCSAVCTHLGGVVRWNNLEKSWDCPCHGSRYDAEGRVLNGPAVENLELIEQEERVHD
jgi:glycine/D-amino acid oxidase-like deaminating enzyme/nitrite reductase/ring-hydroxylating ferredoxin subunit